MTEKHHTIHIPQTCTKRLKIQKTNKTQRKLTISTNWLPIFGFTKSQEVVEEVVGKGKGLIVRLANKDDSKTKKVYQRAYKSRRNNPLETMLDIRAQGKIDEAFGDCNEVHIKFEAGKITIKPVTDIQAERIKKARNTKDMMRAFVACSAGIDAHSIASHGISIDVLLSTRPEEKRDRKDLSETGALCAANNLPINHIFNEDIFTIDTAMLKRAIKENNTSLLSISTECDDLSPVKSNSLKERSKADLSISSDMVYDALKIIEECQIPFVLLENVPFLLKTDFHTLFETKLRKWGYQVYSEIIDASEHGGCSKRKRAYVFATTFGNIPFSFPRPEKTINSNFWENDVEPFLEGCRDVSHCKSIQDGAKCGRLRVVTKDSTHYPVLLRSQSRQAKDSLVIKHQGKYLFPSEEMERHIMGIPSSFNLDTASKSIASEILGQAVEYKSHSNLVAKVKEHMQSVIDSFGPAPSFKQIELTGI